MQHDIRMLTLWSSICGRSTYDPTEQENLPSIPASNLVTCDNYVHSKPINGHTCRVMIWQYAPWLLPHHTPGFNLLVYVCVAGRVRTYKPNCVHPTEDEGIEGIEGMERLLIYVGIHLSTKNWDFSRTGSKGLSGPSGHHPSIQLTCNIYRGLITWLQTYSSFSSLNPLDLSCSLVLPLCTLAIGQRPLLDKDWPWTNQKGAGKLIRSVDFRTLHNSLTRSPVACSFSQISIVKNSFALCPWRATAGLRRPRRTMQRMETRTDIWHTNLSLTVIVIIPMYVPVHNIAVQMETPEHKLLNSQRVLSIEYTPQIIGRLTYLIIFPLLFYICLPPWDKEAFSGDMRQGYPH